jgi:hypothetical protein
VWNTPCLRNFPPNTVAPQGGFGTNYIIFHFAEIFIKKIVLYVKNLEVQLMKAIKFQAMSTKGHKNFITLTKSVTPSLWEAQSFGYIGSLYAKNFKIKNSSAQSETSNYINYLARMCWSGQGTTVIYSMSLNFFKKLSCSR